MYYSGSSFCHLASLLVFKSFAVTFEVNHFNTQAVFTREWARRANLLSSLFKEAGREKVYENSHISADAENNEVTHSY